MNTSITKFNLNNGTEIKEHYYSQGYVVVKDILNHENIDNFIQQYHKIKYNKLFVYYSQSLHLPLRPKITPEGFIEESMERVGDLRFFPEFSKSVLNCLIDRQISNVLSIISGLSKHTLWQHMFFDKSTGTVEHQDHYYLDTDPPGSLIGAWYALEDIHPKSGCFFVIPGSHKGLVIDPKCSTSNIEGIEALIPEHEKMRKEIMNLIQEQEYEYKAFPLNKGDVLFWHPNTIHGAYKNENPDYSRKSFTAHFYPSHFKRANARTPWLKKSFNPDIYIRANTARIYAWNAKQYAAYLLNKLRRQKAVIDMRRKSYIDYS